MSEWDYDYLSMLDPPELEISSDGSGSIRFGALEGVLDVMSDEWRPDDILQFTIVGSDEGDEIFGRGCAMIRDELLMGRIAFHQGEVSDFEAERLMKNG